MDCSPQTPLSLGFSRQEYWSGLPSPPPGDLPNPEVEPTSLCLLHWQAGSLPTEAAGKPHIGPTKPKYLLFGPLQRTFADFCKITWESLMAQGNPMDRGAWWLARVGHNFSN